jgi:hypothetical protein
LVKGPKQEVPSREGAGKHTGQATGQPNPRPSTKTQDRVGPQIRVRVEWSGPGPTDCSGLAGAETGLTSTSPGGRREKSGTGSTKSWASYGTETGPTSTFPGGRREKSGAGSTKFWASYYQGKECFLKTEGRLTLPTPVSPTASTISAVTRRLPLTIYTVGRGGKEEGGEGGGGRRGGGSPPDLKDWCILLNPRVHVNINVKPHQK